MQVTCPHCKQVVVYEGQCPEHCGHCNQVLFPETHYHDAQTAVETHHAAETRRGETGAVIGPYRLVRQLGQGGMGVVWEAEHRESGRRVALKLLSTGPAPTKETIERFIREGRLAASLSHPRTTFIFGAGQHDGQPFIVMELMSGRTLQNLVEEEGPLPIQRAVDHILDVIDGLEAAHQLGVIHRDVKPSNCFLDSDGRVKVGDFGLSKSLVSDVQLTQTGTFMGTPQFAAPEQMRGTDVDERTDIYAVGATLYYLIANRGPFTGDAVAMIAQIVSDPPAPLGEVCPNVPRSLDGVVSRTLEKDPQRRYADLAELRRALQPFATGGTSIADVWRRLAAYMLDVMLLSLVAAVVSMVGQMILMTMAISRADSENGAYNMNQPFGIWQGVSQLGMALCQVGYFFVAEARWGRGVGKLLMGLRVVDEQGERPSWTRSLVRAFFVPGAIGLVAAAPLYMLLHGSNGTATQPNLSVQELVIPTLIWFIPMAFVLLCLTTMRRRNGYRGLHELASGTRVVRLQSAARESEWRKIPRVVPFSMEKKGLSYGPFHVDGTLATSNSVTVYQATDELLQRTVWIYVGPNDDSSVVTRPKLVDRPTRPHWLQGGASETVRWDAFEAVVGSPLPDVVAHGRKIDWRGARFWLRDLADELRAASDDNTLPAQLTLDQVWVDRSGRAKLLDAPLRPIASGGNSVQTSTAAPVQQAVDLLQSAVALCSKGQLLPTHTQRFITELEQREAVNETLDWAAQQLREIAERPVRLAWDSRLAVLAASFGSEFSFYLLFAFGIPLLLSMLIGNSTGLWIVLSVLLTQVPPLALGFSFRGGPIFRFTKIEVLRKNGFPASRLRCTVRNLFAWFPGIFAYSLLGLLGTALLISESSGFAGGDMVKFREFEPQQFLFFDVSMCAGLMLGLLGVVGAIYAVVRPQRGLQDLLAGTYLVPK